MTDPQIKVIKDIPIAYVAKKGFPSIVAGKAFFELEQKVPLQGNKFFGIFDENKNEYRACVAITEENKDIIRNFDKSIIPGGSYAYVVLTGNYNDILCRIKPALDLLIEKYKRDLLRSNVEFYKRHTEVYVMLPIV